MMRMITKDYLILHWMALLIVLSFLIRQCQADVIVNSFSDETHEFSHMAQDTTNGRLFIGAKNRLFELSENLRKRLSIETGPHSDNAECPGKGPCDKVRVPTDNYNKVLVIDKERDRLLVCGTLFQGVCEVRSLRNISEKLYPKEGDEWYYIAANNKTASTVAFIAPGPSSTFSPQKTNQVLVVGTSYTSTGSEPKVDYRELVPQVSSRSLEPDSLFELIYTGISSKSSLSIFNKDVRRLYPIHYKYGFSSDGFSYLLTVQGMKVSSTPDSSSPFISKLVRICERDKNYWSFTEVPLQCGEYNLANAGYVGRAGVDLAKSFSKFYSLNMSAEDDVLFVVFSKSLQRTPDLEYTDIPTDQSALCVYPLKYIRMMFTQNIRECFEGNGVAIQWLPGDAIRCQKSPLVIEDDFCAIDIDINIHLDGQFPVTAKPLLTYGRTQLTSVVTTQVQGVTVAFVGTGDGKLKKVTVNSATSANEYEELLVDPGHPVLPDMTLDLMEKHVYAMTPHQVSKVVVRDCYKYSTCQECLGARDPYCGWCSVENKCSPSSECLHGSTDDLNWVMYRNGQCSVITEVYPNQLQITLAQTLDIKIDHFPKLSGQFMCVFTAFGNSLQTAANRTMWSEGGEEKAGVKCRTPLSSELAPIPYGEQYYTTKLSVKVVGSPEFVSTDFRFYDCNLFKSCTSCTNSSFACNWCRSKHRCTHDIASYCRDDHIITGLSVPGRSNRPGPDFCPQINSSTTEFLIASGSSDTQVVVQAINVEDIVQDDRIAPFRCQYNVDGRVTTVPATYESGLISADIKCGWFKFEYNRPVESIPVQFAILYGPTSDNRPLDNPKNIKITVYKCEKMAARCGFCLTLDPKYRCAWCQDEEKCKTKETCPTYDFLDGQSICPNPTIEEVKPKTGPYEGGTDVTISGYNLGLTFDDIKEGVFVADNECVPYKHSYIPTRQIVCKTKATNKGSKGRFKVVIRRDSRYEGSAPSPFKFVDPQIMNISTKVGPRSGGTKVTIRGRHMNAGSSINAFVLLDQQLGCRVIRTTKDEAECVTSEAMNTGRGVLTMRFDNAVRNSSDYFEYKQDPYISAVRPSGGIPSGGVDIYVEGHGLNVVQEPMMYVNLDGQNFISPCVIKNVTVMVCKSPMVQPAPDKTLALDYGFFMDDVETTRNISRRPGFEPFILYPDPIVLNFTEEKQIKRYKSDYLAISISNLCEVCNTRDFFEVRIGKDSCNVSSVAPTLLNCQPPPTQPESARRPKDQNSLPEVVVYVGGSRREYLIGYLDYELEDDKLPMWAIIIIAAGAAVMLMIVIIILIAYRYQSSKSERMLKNVQEQMDVLELRVAAECKEAFAELQTDMTFLTDLSGCGIPFLEYRNYSLKVLFPNQDDHPVLRELDVDLRKKKSVEKALRQFGYLVMNKTFLLLFIQTLESNKYFSMKDRVNVASLIMVALQNKMEYCTDILKTLLADLIERSIEGNSHPKLLLRRTESVAEKMLTAWFTFLLYRFLREHAGEPLFLLYMAIQQQIEKGPVDSVTSEAKYSLSEEKLIRQQVDYRQMTVYVSGLDITTENQETPVKVLDCDTISQVKEKALNAIYKSTPYSRRPMKEHLDLEWRTGVSGRLVLQDDDISTKQETEWKHLNTLAHYKVPDCASLALVPKQSMFNPNTSLVSDRSVRSDGSRSAVLPENVSHSSLRTASPPLNRTATPMDRNFITEPPVKYWHLMRPQENEAHKEGERSNKLVSEIYLTRLLATKGTLQKFVDDLFEIIFSTNHRVGGLPHAIKYMFDFLDDQALQHGITDHEVVHTWKSNSLPLRFWVNLIKNPNFVFDIHKTTIQDACLSVIAQTFMDSCSTSDHRLGKDSPASKLLYAKDIPTYKEWVEKYYQEIKLMAAISDQDMNAVLAEESRTHTNEFNTNVALFELYGYACKYNEQLMRTLQDDEFSRKNKLSYKLEQVHNTIAETDT